MRNNRRDHRLNSGGVSTKLDNPWDELLSQSVKVVVGRYYQEKPTGKGKILEVLDYIDNNGSEIESPEEKYRRYVHADREISSGHADIRQIRKLTKDYSQQEITDIINASSVMVVNRALNAILNQTPIHRNKCRRKLITWLVDQGYVPIRKYKE